MRQLMMALAALLVAGTVLTTAPRSAEACRCQAPDVSRSYSNNSDVFRGQVLKKVTYRTWTVYYARIHETYKGCERRGQIVRLLTPTSSATCGAQLQRGQNYLINGTRRYRGYISINSCEANFPFSQVSREDLRFLNTRYNCCGDRCACVHAPLVNCFVDPCDFAEGCDEGGECVSNYCGGCHAEFYDEQGEKVCDEAPCRSDDDCDDDTWCRPNQDNINECVPFANESDFCGGFTPIWAQQRCAPGLVCTDVPEFLPDAPGHCRVPCDSNRDCGQDQYCSGNGACRDDGACLGHLDCEMPGNDFSHIECVGYGVCEENSCGWRCGDARCRDLGGVMFGFCDAVLGVGVVNGACQAISGCDANGYTLFEDMRSCNVACSDR